MSREFTPDLRLKVEPLLASMKRHGVIDKMATANDISLNDIYEFAVIVGVGPIGQTHRPQAMPLDELLSQLQLFSNVNEVFNKKFAFLDKSAPSPFHENLKLSKAGTLPNIFGLPCLDRGPAQLVYHARKLTVQTENAQELARKKNEKELRRSDSIDRELKEQEGNKNSHEAESVVIAQRKVAKALFGMVGNETMLFHFVTKGGIEACEKLVRECKFTNKSYKNFLFVPVYLTVEKMMISF